jgi:hypothetical protein
MIYVLQRFELELIDVTPTVHVVVLDPEELATDTSAYPGSLHKFRASPPDV